MLPRGAELGLGAAETASPWRIEQGMVMNDQPATNRKRWRRLSIAVAMSIVAIAAITIALLRPLLLPVPMYAAGDILDEYGPQVHPDLDQKHYRAESAQQTPSGYWRVRFVRVAGNGPPHKDVIVSDQYVKKTRVKALVGGESPRTALQRSRPQVESPDATR
jgi:hypothetical protein